MWETRVWSLGWEDPLEEGMETHPSIRPGESPWTEEPGRLQFMGSQRVRHDWATKHTQKTTQIPINKWIDKQFVIYQYNGILLSNKNSKLLITNFDSQNNKGESQNNNTKWKKPNHKKEYTVWFHLYKILENKN